MTLERYRVKLGWSKAQLAREAGVRAATVSDAEKGKNIYKATAGKLANALSTALGQEITYEQIEGLAFAD
jgi:transcriptional regulator with XRE-family HTH domain